MSNSWGNRGFRSFSFVSVARWLIGFMTMTTLILLVSAETVAAEEEKTLIIIPLETVVRADEGSTTPLETVQVSEDLIGQLCTVTAQSMNQHSVHPNNDLLVESGTSQITIPDVESDPGGIVTATEQLELGTEIVVSLLMGPDEVFSAGMEVRAECVPNDTTTTTIEAIPTTTTEATTTTTEATTTTTEPEETTTTTIEDEVLGTEVTTTTEADVEDEVLGTEVLPFTGEDGDALGTSALALLAAGALVLAAAGRETS